MWRALVPRLARPFVGRPIAMATSGSSDMTFNYLQLACFLAIAARHLERRRARSRRRPAPPLVTDAARWRRVVFDYQGQGSILLMSDERNQYKTKIDEKKKTIDFANRYDPRDAFRLAYLRPDPA